MAGALAVAEARPENVAQGVAVRVLSPVAVAHAVAVAVTEGLAEAVAEAVRLAPPLPLRAPLPVAAALALALALSEGALAEGAALWEAPPTASQRSPSQRSAPTAGEPLLPALAVGGAVHEGDSEALADAVGDAEKVGVAVNTPLVVEEGVAQRVAVPLRLAPGDADAPPRTLPVGEPLTLALPLAVRGIV